MSPEELAKALKGTRFVLTSISGGNRWKATVDGVDVGGCWMVDVKHPKDMAGGKRPFFYMLFVEDSEEWRSKKNG